MKRYLLLACILLTGCAHPYVKSWSGDTVKLCGAEGAGRDFFDKEASQQCSKGYKALSGDIEDSGDYNIRAGYHRHHVVVSDDKEQCVVYQCTR